MNRLIANSSKGISLIELIIAVAFTSVIFSGAHSWYANHAIRTKIAEVLSTADTAKMAINIACTENSGIAELTNNQIGHSFPASLYVKSVTVSGSCTSPIITTLTVNTGLLIDPTLTITSDNSVNNVQRSWTCASDGLNVHMPDAVRKLIFPRKSWGAYYQPEQATYCF